MPELPEVETMRRGVLPVVGGRIVRLGFPRCQAKPISVYPNRETVRRRVKGQQIKAVDRIGKRVVLRLESDDSLVFEPRMTGLVLLADLPGPEHLRVQLELADCEPQQLLYWDRRGLGHVKLLTPAEVDASYGPSKLGPDALTITAEQLRQRLKASRRAIKVALLDQKAVLGIGNLYASEMLHAARIHPGRRCDRLTKAEWSLLHAEMRRVLMLAIEYEGSTLSDGTYRNALNKQGGYQNEHRVYDKANVVCPTCGDHTIERIVQAQRSTFFCPGCQRRSPWR